MVLHKMYFAVGTFNLTSYDFTHVLLFNKKMARTTASAICTEL